MVVILRWIRTSVPTTYSYWPGLEEGLRLLQKCYYIQLLILHSPYIITTLSRVGTYCRYVCTLPLHVCTPYCTSKLIVNGTCGISWYYLHVCRCLIGPIIRARFQVLVIRRNRKWTRPISTLRALPGSLPITLIPKYLNSLRVTLFRLFRMFSWTVPRLPSSRTCIFVWQNCRV